MKRTGIPWGALAVVVAASLAGGWLLASGTRRVPAPPLHRHGSRAAGVAQQATPAATLPNGTATPVGVESPTFTSPPVHATPAAPGGARLAIIIDDCGQWPATERALIDLPIPLTVSIMPDAPYRNDIAKEASAAGQGVMLHLPMEPLSGTHPGTGEITTSMDDAQIEAQVRQDLKNVPLARGVNNHEGSKATADPRVMHDVAEVLAAEGQYFVDSRTTAATVAAKETEALDIPTASRKVFLDNEVSVRAVEAALALAGESAKKDGSAIAIGHPKPATLEALRADIPALEQDGVTFVLASDLVH